MKRNARQACLRTYLPDGLDEVAVDVLIAEVAVQVAGMAEPTSALLDGSAIERRRRRMERRALAEVVRCLPAVLPAAQPIEKRAS